MRRFTTVGLLWLSCWSLLGCSVNLEPLAVFGNSGEAGPSFSTFDVHGRPIEVGVPSENVVILFFNGETTSDAMQPITAEIAVAFYQADDLDFVNVVDLRTLPFYARPFAPGGMRDAGGRTIGRVNRRLRDDGLPELENLHDHLFLIADEGGEITDHFSVPDSNQIITAIVYNRDGSEVGRFDPQQELEAVIAAIAQGRASTTVDDNDR